MMLSTRVPAAVEESLAPVSLFKVPEESSGSSRRMRRVVGANLRAGSRLGPLLLAEYLHRDSCGLRGSPKPLIHGLHLATD